MEPLARRNPLARSDLSGAYLIEADLRDANLGEADLAGANLHRADLSQANLHLANLRHANLSAAHLRGADLTQANLIEVNLGEADLHGATLTQSKLGWTVFVNNDLRSVIGLDTVVHIGPSSIGIDTIHKSGGKLREAFLRGAGVPEPFIANMKVLVGAMSPIEFYSCFISYSHADKQFARSLHDTLHKPAFGAGWPQ
jgi:hypothetical protein